MLRTSPQGPSGRSVIAAFGGALFVFAVTHFLPVPGTLHDVMTKNGGHEILDLDPAFSSEGVYQRLSSFGEAGREAYFRMMLSMDILFPLAFTVFLFLLARYAIRKSRPRRFKSLLLLLLPFGYFIADMVENLSVAWLIREYPYRHDALASTLGYISAAKRICMYGAVFLPLIALSLGLMSDKMRAR